MININIQKFLDKFNGEYSFLYQNRDNVCGYRESVEAFDNFLNQHSEFVREFVRYRGDIISSDREASAFMFALESLS